MQRTFQVDWKDKRFSKRQKVARACRRCRNMKKRCNVDDGSVACRPCEQIEAHCSFQNDSSTIEPSEGSGNSGVPTSSDFQHLSDNNAGRSADVGSVPFSMNSDHQRMESGQFPTPQSNSSVNVTEMEPISSQSIHPDTRIASELRYSSMLELVDGNRPIPKWWDYKLIGSSNPLSALLRKDIKHRIVTGLCDFRAQDPGQTESLDLQRLACSGTWDWEGFYRARGMNPHHFEYLRSLGCFSLPKPDRIGFLLDIYFTRVHPLLPIIDRGDLLSKIFGVGEPPPLVLLHAIFLAASRYASSSSDAQVAEIRSECDRQHTRLRALIDLDLPHQRLAVLRASLIASFHWEGREGVNSAIDSLSLAVRIAQEMGLHRGQMTEPADGMNDLMARRIWWCLYAFDRFNAAQEGTPFLINENDCSVETLQHIDLPDEDRITQSIVLSNISLSKVIEATIRSLYGPNSLHLSSQRNDLLSELQHVEEHIESSSTHEKARIQGMSSLWRSLLLTHVYAVRILILRPFLLEYDHESGTYPCRDRCRRCAFLIIDLLEQVKQSNSLRFSWPFTVYALVNALLIVWYDISSPADLTQADRHQTRQRFLQIRDLLQEMGQTWWAAAAKHKLSEALLRVADAFAQRQDRQIALPDATWAPHDQPTSVRTPDRSWIASGGDSLDAMIPPNQDENEFWGSLGLDFETDVAGNILGIFQ